VEKTTWQNDGNGNFRSTVLIHAPDKQSFASEYQSYLKQWQLLTHPAAFRIAEFHINPSDLAMQTQIVLTGFSEDYEPIGNRLSFLTPLEKAAILQQSADLAFYMQKQGISQQTWDMENLYIHKSGICQWLPSIAGSRIANEKIPDSLMALALMLFDLPVPQTDADWRDLKLTWDTDEKTDGKLPQEWIVFIKNLSMQTDSDFGNIFRFVFFQSWLYDMAVQFLMKDKQLSLPQSDLLKHLRLFLGIDEKQAESLAIISHKSDILWTDLKTASNGETLTTSGPEPPKKSSLSFHPDRACNTVEEHIGRESREKFVSHGYDRLAGTSDVQSFAIIGFYKEGKTSFVNYIRQPKVMEKYLGEDAGAYKFIYINIRHGNITDEAGFFKALYSEVGKIRTIEKLKDGSDLERITNHLGKNNLKLVVILDNFDQIVVNQNFPVTFYERLRSWFSTHKDVGCILTSPLELLKLNASFELLDSPFFNIFNSYSIVRLTGTEAAELIRSRLPKSMADREEDISRLIDEFGCSPYPLHVAGKFWTEHFSRKEKNPLETAIEEAYKELKGYYGEIFSRIGSNKIRDILEGKTGSRIDKKLIDLGWVREGEKGYKISSKQSERFFKDKLGIRDGGIWGNIRRLIAGRK